MLSTKKLINDNNFEENKNTKEQNQIIDYQYFGKISEKESQEFIRNNFQDKTNIYVMYDKIEKKFLFFDNNHNNHNNNSNYIGSFSVEDLIKYASEPFDNKNQFMSHVNRFSYCQSVVIIKNFIVTIEMKNKIKYAYISFHNYQTSPFMGDIELLIRLNDDLYNFEKYHLDKELTYVHPENAKYIKQTILRLIYMLLNYILQLIVIISDEIKNKPEIKTYLKDYLIKYSICTVYRISQFVQNQLNIVLKRDNELKKLFILHFKLKKNISLKMEKLIEEIKKQNDILFRKYYKSQDSLDDYKNKLSSPSNNFSAIYSI